MKEFSSTIGLIFLILLILFACDAEGLGESAGKMVSAYEKEVNND